MKRTLSLILAALLLASAMTACGGETKETNPVETNAVETNAPATNAPETEAPTSTYDPSVITENGVAKAHIVVLDGADELEEYAAEELAYHIKKVSGAEVSITAQAETDSLPIIIATPDTLPELEALFADDLAWIRDLGEGTTRYGDDGFSIRTHEGKIYIFGATAKGALNGVYDFIEENMGILWVRANEDIGLIYDEQPTVTVSKTDYREKSPFRIRGWHLCGGNDPNDPNDSKTALMLARNKFSTTSEGNADYGLTCYGVAHNVKALIKNSPIYDPNESEYWCTNPEAKHVTYEASPQINFFSDKAVKAVAASIIRDYKDTNEKYAFIGIEDTVGWGDVYPEQTEPFEYAPGQFVEPDSTSYQSTVFFTFVNKVARLVKEELPDLSIGAFAYHFSLTPPVCEIDDNVCVTYCTFKENLTTLTEETWGDRAVRDFKNLKGWTEITGNIMVYSYYGCMKCGSIYSRPVWDRLQSDAQFFAEHGFTGVQAEGVADDEGNIGWLKEYYGGVSPYTNSNEWAMNALPFWIYGKLLWNPYEDVEALIVEFCDKVYGDASEAMQEYYRLVQLGWKDGAELMSTEFNNIYELTTPPMTYWDYFINVTVDDINILEGIQDALNKAWDAANDAEKEHIRYMKEIFDNPEDHFVK